MISYIGRRAAVLLQLLLGIATIITVSYIYHSELRKSGENIVSIDQDALAGSALTVTNDSTVTRSTLAGNWATLRTLEATNKQEGGSNIKTADPTTPESENRSLALAIHLVVVPYFIYGVKVPQLKALERQEEYRTVLQRNLNHKFVSHVHVLTTSAKDIMEHFKGLANHSKLVVAEVSSIERMRDPWEYISQNLVGKDVMFANADIYLGDGFELVDPLLMAQQKIMYSLTRQVAANTTCPGDIDKCLKAGYIGSHDSFLFHLSEPLPDEALEELEFPLPSYGMENVILWIFQRMLKFCTLNPCSILQTIHFHCSDLRDPKKRDDTKRTGRAPFTNNLFC